MPPARPIKEECTIQTREDTWMSELKRYMRDNCGKARTQ